MRVRKVNVKSPLLSGVIGQKYLIIQSPKRQEIEKSWEPAEHEPVLLSINPNIERST